MEYVLCSGVVCQFDMEPLLLAKILIGVITGKPIAAKNFCIHKAWAVACMNAIYLDSTVDNTTVSSCLLCHDTEPPATIKILPLANCLVSLHPA